MEYLKVVSFKLALLLSGLTIFLLGVAGEFGIGTFNYSTEEPVARAALVLTA